MVRSGHVEDRPRRWAVPRWVFEAWLWLNVPASLLADYGCPWKDRERFCEQFGNSVGSLFGLFPTSLEPLFAAFIGLDPIVWVCLVAATASCHALLRRYAPEKLGLWSVLALLVGWGVLTFLTYFAGFYTYFVFNPPGAAFRSAHWAHSAPF